MLHPASRGTQRTRRVTRSGVAVVSVAALLISGLAGCASDDEDTPVLTWYVNPDGKDTLNAIAEDCATDQYTIDVQPLPNNASEQRTQLARRLAAEDSSTDLMSLDPVFVPEFASAGWLAPFTGDTASRVVDDDVLEGAAASARWDGTVVAAPQWANTQVLWYRRSLAEAAGLDMSQPVTWEQVISAAEKNDGTLGVQANKYEGYTVWINALVAGAGGEIIADPEAGKDADVTIDSAAGRDAARVIERVADSPAAPRDLSVSNEGTSLGSMFPAQGAGEFMVNWTFVYSTFAEHEQAEDLGWARYPATVEGKPSRPPIGGIAIGVGAFSDHVDLAREAAVCVSSAKAQEQLALNDGLMPSRASVYESAALTETYPKDLLALFRTSIDEAGPRPASAFYNQISGALQSTWHSPTSVDPDTTPKRSATFITDVLRGRRIL